MAQVPRERKPDNIVGDLEQYDQRPLNLCREKTVTRGLPEIIALCAFRAAERKLSINATAKLPGVNTPALWALLSGLNKDVSSAKLLALIDGLGMQVVLRPKPVPLSRQTRPEQLQSTKLAKAAKAANAAKRMEQQSHPQPDAPVLPEDLPQEVQVDPGPVGVITAEMRRDIDRMLAS